MSIKRKGAEVGGEKFDSIKRKNEGRERQKFKVKVVVDRLRDEHKGSVLLKDKRK